MCGNRVVQAEGDGADLVAADIDTGALPPRLPGPALEGVMTSLEAVTSVLEERAVALGARIVRDAPRPTGRTASATPPARWSTTSDSAPR
ncbi:hypothetical protein [Streptomyces sp. NPDC051079]|uniref:hypothetical protein n=1 Tax=Streptomyces sp. NPDC051079 TaxID=3155043 RepID=UPI00344D7DFD